MRSGASRCRAEPAGLVLRHGRRSDARRRRWTPARSSSSSRSEQEYTFQRPGEYITSVLAGCIAAGWEGPVFVQGDHYQFNAAKYRADPNGVTDTLRKATLTALEVGYGNIDDSSTLVDLSRLTVDDQQRENARARRGAGGGVHPRQPRRRPRRLDRR